MVAASCGSPPATPRTLERMAREVGADVVAWVRRGIVPGRSGELVLVAEPDNVVTRRGSWVPDAEPPLDTSHSTPWARHQRVPILLSGPGIRPEAVHEPIDVSSLRGLIEPWLGKVRAVIVVVWDGGGWNLLREYPHDWPFLRSVMRRGRLYTNATVGSSPSVTASVHATIGTGVYPSEHGIPDNTVRRPDGTVGDPWLDRTDPTLLRVETFGDSWDRATTGRAWVGLLATEPWHVGMLGHGSALGEADRDVAVLWDRARGRWFTNPRFYELPAGLPESGALAERLDDLDASDGSRDGAWRGNDLGDPSIVPGTPAFVRHQSEAVLEVLAREPVGEDGVTDILLVEVKSTDRGAHVWNLYGEEEAHVLRAQDDMLRELDEALERKVGRGRYLLVYTADHGLTPLPEEVGGLRIHPEAVGRRIEERFGPIVEAVTPASVFLDRGEVRRRGIELAEVARFVGDLSYADGLPDEVDRATIPEDVLRRRIFAGVFPGEWLVAMSDGEIASLGRGLYGAEGDLRSPVDVP